MLLCWGRKRGCCWLGASPRPPPPGMWGLGGVRGSQGKGRSAWSVWKGWPSTATSSSPVPTEPALLPSLGGLGAEAARASPAPPWAPRLHKGARRSSSPSGEGHQTTPAGRGFGAGDPVSVPRPAHPPRGVGAGSGPGLAPCSLCAPPHAPRTSARRPGLRPEPLTRVVWDQSVAGWCSVLGAELICGLTSVLSLIFPAALECPSATFQSPTDLTPLVDTTP